MSRFVDNTRLFQAIQQKDRARRLSLSDFVRRYVGWARLPATFMGSQFWYRLRLSYRAGLFGKTRSSMDVNFFDGSGEGFFEASRSPGLNRLWKGGYLDARVMVFCLPLWVAFPGTRLSPRDWQERSHFLQGFERVVLNYEELRRENKRTHPVRSILALTMADDNRGALTTLYERWIAPYLEAPHVYLRRLRSGSGITQYLAEARRVSAALHQELSASSDPRVSSIPQALDFGARLWVIPTSAIEGSRLDRIEREYGSSDARPELHAPVPVHVELPLLLALCERTNALM